MTLTKVALPKEHGSWGFVLEPLLLSLIVAFSSNGLLLATVTFFLFLSSQPLKIIANKSLSKKARTTASFIFLAYLLFSIVLLVFPIYKLELNKLIPFFIALFLMPVYVLAVLKNFSRNLFVELLPIISMTLIAISIVTIDDSFIFNPIIFGALLLSRAVPTVLYVSAKVKETKGFKYSVTYTHILNFGFLLFIISASLTNSLPTLTILGSVMLIVRSAIGFSRFSFAKTIKQIGVMEFIYGALFVAINGIAFLI